MPNTVLVGAQWGDEGKGKVIDVLTRDVDWVVRYQGGSNAGHTVEVGNSQHVLHLIPSGILREGRRCVIGNGVVVDPLALVEEIAGLREAGHEVEGRLVVSDRAHLVLPSHKQADAGRESRRAEADKIGTTLRGIGPAYADKSSRTGLRMGAMRDPAFLDRLRAKLEEDNASLAAQGMEPLEVEAVLAPYADAAAQLAPLILDTVPLLNDAIGRGESLLFEGAQGTMLDIDFGTYPYVTSSNSTAGGAATGSGVPPHRIDRVIGVVKAYTTRVGRGPFPTELEDRMGEHLRQIGREFGATTGRPRRCGWFDAVVARYSAMVNGIDEWALTKLDVLDGVNPIRIATAYRVGDRTVDTVPGDIETFTACQPVYEDVPGWTGTVRDARRFEDLPKAARAYVRRLEALTGVPVRLLSVGPNRDSTLRLPG